MCIGQLTDVNPCDVSVQMPLRVCSCSLDRLVRNSYAIFDVGNVGWTCPLV